MPKWKWNRSKIEEKKEWGDLAVVANDNAFLKRIGEDLDRDGISDVET